MPHNPLTSIIGEGRCATCGFLAQYVAWATATPIEGQIRTLLDGEAREVQLHMRAYGNFTDYARQPNVHWNWAAPLCFIYAADPSLAEEVKYDPKAPDALDRKIVAEAIQKDRKCDQWFEYRPGRHPNEHVRMRDMIELEKDRRKWEAMLEADRRTFEERLSERNEQFLTHLHVDNKAADDRQKKRDDRITFFFLILAGLEVAGTVAAVAIAISQWVSQ